MSKAVSRGQALDVVARAMTNISWDELDGARFQNEVVNLSPEEIGRRFTEFLKGGCRPTVIITAPEGKVDLAADPYLPDGWKVEEHQKGDVVKLERKGDDLYLDDKKIDFYLSKKQKNGWTIVGNELRKELAKIPVLNANVLDYLLKNPHLIPEAWKFDGNGGHTRYILFWGTIYRDSDGLPCVRYLFWNGRRWDWSCGWLGYDWDSDFSVVVLAS